MTTPSPHNPLAAFTLEQTLPEPLPADPFPTLAAWLDEARQRKTQPNPNAFALATADAAGTPAVRVVLCKGLNAEPQGGYFVFYTNYHSAKSRQLDANPRAAAVMHWDHLGRQVRIEGPVVKSPIEESDAYFASRPLDSKLGAWASDQSQPIASRDELLDRVVEMLARFNVSLDDPEAADVPRPPHWGGYRLWAEHVELWVHGPGRVHDRARWSRKLVPVEGGFTPDAWSSTRLQP